MSLDNKIDDRVLKCMHGAVQTGSYTKLNCSLTLIMTSLPHTYFKIMVMINSEFSLLGLNNNTNKIEHDCCQGHNSTVINSYTMRLKKLSRSLPAAAK